ncbi:MAG: TetR/AcrR family transcriptional regulator [Lautropia sp.]
MRKGQQTRRAIVDAALTQAARAGLEGLTIGALAEQMQMSKSGVFAHFGSREELQIAVLKAYEERFIDAILKSSLREPRGLPRLLAMLGQWLERTVIEAELGCIWISGATEYDDRPGPVRDELVAMIQGWQRELRRAIEQAMTAGHLTVDTDVEDLMFGLYGVILVLHHDARLMRSPDALPRARRTIERLLSSQLTAAARPLLAGFNAAAMPRAGAADDGAAAIAAGIGSAAGSPRLSV